MAIRWSRAIWVRKMYRIKCASGYIAEGWCCCMFVEGISDGLGWRITIVAVGSEEVKWRLER